MLALLGPPTGGIGFPLYSARVVHPSRTRERTPHPATSSAGSER